MASWSLVPCLVKLRTEFNDLFPDRDKASDGSIGDTAHSARTSDHNPAGDGQVHAIDVDINLAPGVSMLAYVNHIVERCRTGAENRLTYVIFNRRIWAASTGWQNRAYDGTNPHDKHVHFSASYTPARESNTRSWLLEEVPVALTNDDRNDVRAIVRTEIAALKAEVAKVPTAEEIAEALWTRVRTSQQSLLSDTATNLSEARITEAVKDGVAIARFPFNVGK